MDTLTETLTELYNILGKWRSTSTTIEGAVRNLVQAEQLASERSEAAIRQLGDVGAEKTKVGIDLGIAQTRIHNLENSLKVVLAYYRYQTERLTDDRSMPIITAENVLNNNGECTDEALEMYLLQYRRNRELREALELYANPDMWTSDVTIYYDNADGSEGEFTTDLGIKTVWDGDGEGFEYAQEIVGKP